MRLFLRMTGLAILAFGIWGVAHPSSGSALQQTVQAEARELTPGLQIERDLALRETHPYQLSLNDGQFLSLRIEQKGIDVEILLFGPDGKQIVRTDQSSAHGTEWIFFQAASAGIHRVELRPKSDSPKSGRYQLNVLAIRDPNDQDKVCLQAYRAFMASMALSEQRTSDALQKVMEKGIEALNLWRSIDEKFWEARTLKWLGEQFSTRGDWQKAYEHWDKSLAIWRVLENRREEINLLNSLGVARLRLGDPRKAIDYFEQSLDPAINIEGERDDLVTRFNVGVTWSEMGETLKSLEAFERLLPGVRAQEDRTFEATLLNSFSVTYARFKDSQKAVWYLNEALRVLRATKEIETSQGRVMEATFLNNIGVIYQEMHDYERALDALNQALPVFQTIGNRRMESTVLTEIASVKRLQGEYQPSLELLQKALSLAREAKDQRAEANALSKIGLVWAKQEDYQKALDYHIQGLNLRQAVKDKNGEAEAHVNIGETWESLGDYQKASDAWKQGLACSREVGNRSNEAHSLFGLARAERKSGNLSEARNLIGSALTIIESIRSSVASRDSRATLQAARRNFYNFETDLLMQFHQQNPTQGYDALALQASERTRARSLLDTLNEARAEIRQGGDPALFDRERSLRQRINDKADVVTRLRNNKRNETLAVSLEKEVSTLLNEWQNVQTEIRVNSPRYAAITQPKPLTLKEIQQQLDGDTILLEYSLGKDRSYLWAVARNAFNSYELPKQADIEGVARRAYDLLTRSHERLVKSQVQGVVGELSKIVLAPAAKEIKGKRLLIVSDGALQYIPFAALPEPAVGRTATTETAQPLIVSHEVVSLPSASVLPLLRQDAGTRTKTTKNLAIIADPVFQTGDQRVKLTVAQKAVTPNAPILLAAQTRGEGNHLTRSGNETGIVDFARLPYTRQEADAIHSLTSASNSLKALDFQASRATVLGAGLNQYRVLHFATHGLLNSQHPELSGLVLSLVDEDGQPQDGFLRLHDIYNLNLGAELVVLSACRTALGKEINGEGLIGLTRGFMYAGAKSVIASLWDVKDETTAELMKRFYQNYLKQGQRPSAALRAAQISVMQEGRWAAPYFWAGFTIQGEWN